MEKIKNEINIVWEPLPGSQKLFLTSPYRETLIEGNRGGGKTEVLIADFLQEVGRGWGADWTGIIFRRQAKELTDIISKTKKMIPRIFPNARFIGSDAKRCWVFQDGEILYFRHMEKEDDYWDFHGHSYTFVGWEELCTWPNDIIYKKMMSTNRSTRKDIPLKYRATANPHGPGHNWVKERFRLPSHRFHPIVDSKTEDGRIDRPRIAIQSTLSENIHLLKAQPDYADTIRSSARNKAELQAWLHGSWDIVSGGMFDDVWDSDVHIIDSFDIPFSWRIDRSFDWGSSKPFSVGWWAESDGTTAKFKDGSTLHTIRGDLFRIAELYGCVPGKPNEGTRLLAIDIAKEIINNEVMLGYRNNNFSRVKSGPADSSIFNVENGMCIAYDMARPIKDSNGFIHRNGVSFIPADKKPGSRKAGWEQMRERLRNSHVPKSGCREYPGLFVFRNCIDFVRTVPVLPRSQRDMDDVDTNAEDHIADETRYRIRSIGNRPSSGTTRGLL